MSDLILKLNRYYHNDNMTQGIMPLEGENPVYTLEDEPREVKVMNETRIPFGRYEIKLRNEGGMNERYSKKFGYHKGMLHLQNVDNFEWVYIHIGNYEDQTSGCILVGESANSCGTISQSTSAYYRVYMACMKAFENGSKVYILISDEPK